MIRLTEPRVNTFDWMGLGGMHPSKVRGDFELKLKVPPVKTFLSSARVICMCDPPILISNYTHPKLLALGITE